MTCLNIFGCSPAIVSRHCYSEITWSSSFTFVQKGRGNVCQSNISRRTAGKDRMVTQLKADQKSFKAVYKETYYLQPPVTEWKEIVWSRESGDLPSKFSLPQRTKSKSPFHQPCPFGHCWNPLLLYSSVPDLADPAPKKKALLCHVSKEKSKELARSVFGGYVKQHYFFCP